MVVEAVEQPRVVAEILDAEDPTFQAGSVHTARALLSNPSAKAWTYDVAIYLGAGLSPVAGQVTIAAGESAYVDLAMTMPTTEGVYNVYLDVSVAGYPEFLEHKLATETITITISPDVDIGDIVWV